MAITPVKYSDPYDSMSIDTKDFAIGGKLITAKCSLDNMFEEVSSSENIKQKLMEQIAGFAIENKLVEFTKIPDMYNGRTTYIARCYLAPDDMVKILRVHSR